MSKRFFDVAKVGVFCDSVTHSTERRKDGEAKVLVVSCRVQPFDAKLAAQVDAQLRQTLFRMNNAEPWSHVKRADFGLEVMGQRQLCTVFATPDTVKASIAFDQVRVTSVAARTGSFSGYALVFKLIFGPASARELEFVEDWRNGQRFITFEPAEPNADLDPEAADENEDAGDTGQESLALPSPEFDTDAAGRPTDGSAPAAASADGQSEHEAARQRLHSHHQGKGRRKAGPTTH